MKENYKELMFVNQCQVHEEVSIKADKVSKEYRDYRESCGMSDPVMLDEIEEGCYQGYILGYTASQAANKESSVVPEYGYIETVYHRGRTPKMETINKNLVLQYLSMALPYDVMVDRLGVAKKVLSVKPSSEACIEVENGEYTSSFYTLDEVKPIVRSMRSMTEDESSELSNIIKEWYDKELFTLTEEPFIEFALSSLNYSISPILFNWLLKKHFDFMGLAEIDLAVEVAEDNNPY